MCSRSYQEFETGFTPNCTTLRNSFTISGSQVYYQFYYKQLWQLIAKVHYIVKIWLPGECSLEWKLVLGIKDSSLGIVET